MCKCRWKQELIATSGNAWVDAPASRNAGTFLYELPRTAWELGANAPKMARLLLALYQYWFIGSIEDVARMK